jgi:ABC-2 type transport system ATP-binding protein
MVPAPQTKEEISVPESFCKAIEEHVAEADYRDAFDKLQDFASNFSPQSKKEILVLRARYNRWRSDQRQGVTSTENINDISAAILEQSESIHVNVSAPPKTDPLSSDAYIGYASTDILTLVQLPTVPPIHSSATKDTDVFETDTLDKTQKLHWQLYNRLKGVPVCQIRQVCKTFGRGAFSLGPISLQLQKGQIIAAVGKNASGKTTLLRICAGDLQPDTGDLEFTNISTSHRDWRSIRSRIAIVPQLPTKWHGPLRQTLNYVASVHSPQKKGLSTQIDWLVNRYDLQDFESKNWDQISGGYRIRFELVRALLCRPDLILLDEPLAYLDIVARRRFLQDISAFARSFEQPIAVLVTSQHLTEIEAIADRIIVLDNGKAVYNGTVDGLKSVAKWRIFHISVDCTLTEFKSALIDYSARAFERTIDGFIARMPLETQMSDVTNRLFSVFSRRLKAVRDITESAEAYIGSELDDDVWKQMPQEKDSF